MVRPVITYRIETVVVTKRLVRRMAMVEMKILRFSLGLSRINKIGNEEETD